MSLGQEFELDDHRARPEPDSVPPPASPIVVVHYRNRGIPPVFLPPLIIVLITAAIVSYRRSTPVRPPTPAPRSAPSRPAESKASTQPKVEPAPGVVSYEPIVIREDGLPVPASSGSPPQNRGDAGARTTDSALRLAAANSGPDASAHADAPPSAGPAAPSTTKPAAATGGASSAAAPAVASDREASVRDTRPADPPPFDLDQGDNPVALVGGKAPGADAGPPNPPLLEEPPSLDPQRPLPKGRQNPPAIGFVPPSADDPPKPEGAPSPISKEEFEEQVRREAARKEAELEAMENVTPQSRFEELVEAIKKANADRAKFHNELRDILRGRGQKTGPLIAHLCDQYGRDVHPAVRAYVSGVALVRLPLRSTIQDRVEILRLHGMPEPMILDYLANDLQKRTRSARNAPRTQDEVRILAARQLLAMPVTKPSDAQIDRSAQKIAKFIVSTPAPSPRRARRP